MTAHGPAPWGSGSKILCASFSDEHQPPPPRTLIVLLDQIDANGFILPGLGIDPHFEADGLIADDFIAFTQCRHVEENVDATIVWFNETKAFFVIEHLNFTGWHAVPQFL
jgi:hypothetical protein